MQHPDIPEERRPSGPTRAAVVHGAVAAGAAGALVAAGGTSADAEDLRPSPSRLPQDQPVETGWRPKRPRLTTPWTHEVSASHALPEYPRPQLVRQQWRSLNGVWQFAAVSSGATIRPGADLAERILVPFPVESALSGIMRHEAAMHYRRRFRVPTSWRIGAGRRLLMHFDAVDWSARVLVNGKQVGTHRGAYDRFSFDVTDALHLDRHHRPSGDQEVVVAVEDPTEDGVQPLGKQRTTAFDPATPHSELYYAPVSGVWGTVWLEPVDTVHVTEIVVTPELPHERAGIAVHLSDGASHPVRLTVRSGGRTVARVAGSGGRSAQVHLPGFTAWSPEHPHLYDVDVEVMAAGRDRVTGYFAMRSVEVQQVDGTPRIVLNGRFRSQISCLQQGYWPDGLYTAATDEALRFDVEQAKRLGFTTIRKHQKTESDRWYHWADRLGVLVWQDMPATATGRQPPKQATPAQPPAKGKVEFERELAAVVRRLRAFPCIVMWIPFNEGWGAYDLARVGESVHAIDPTRLIDDMSGTTTADYDEGGGDVLDWHNLGSHDPGPVPPTSDGRAAVIGEFGAFGYAVEGHEWYPGHSRPNQVVAGAEGLTSAYEQALHQVAGFVRDHGLSAANYNLFEDAELQVNGLYTYDRRVLKGDRARLTAATRGVADAEPAS
ncbi:glycoside hydrolase family 2 protein [Amnibacterium endophyticum]|uniref:Glycoside hydrolase family 2 protein n=1 Tax=Amnibacterium endophyticum TaxID=2109337 RepID=A0ABW4L9N5_9MICO